MTLFNRKNIARLLLFAAAMTTIAVTTNIPNVVAQNGSDPMTKNRLNISVLGKHTNIVKEAPDAYRLPGSSFQSPEVSILEAKDLRGEKVAVRGVVVTDPVIWKNRDGKLSVHIEDDTGGMHVLMLPKTAVKKGDSVRITGTVAEYEGLIEIRPESENIQTGSDGQAPEPRAIHAEDLLAAHKAMPYIGRLVKVKAQIQHIPDKPQAGAYDIPILVGENTALTLYVREDLADLSQIREKTWYEITGILSQYHGYRIIPALGTDIQQL
ncbi:hypothetical protein ACFQI7_25415 [Paenibacillus allorhizosphaerae]|uniref:OB domain-containing protein n=1 Tax=Paenibacillus allorhizosphaerae TaxID=2849866 RepID=A0ABM8VJE7_9BACL|nr:hypothetical protein [Paenibacillus allorhizosphaerae]CAG7645224.1 hypothetical protein PAECIP111802_03460 [Paenibacillus allorhizosphaerae]